MSAIMAHKFAPVDCVCGLPATVSVSFGHTNRLYDVEVACAHGGSERSATGVWRERVKFTEQTVALHNDTSGSIAPLGGAKLGAGLVWVPSAMQALSSKSTIRLIAGETLQRGDLVSLDAQGKAIRATTNSHVVGVATSAVGDMSGSREVDVMMTPSSSSVATEKKTSAEVGAGPGLYAASNLQVGMVVVESSGASVLVSKIQKTPQRLKLTWRRIGDDNYRPIEVDVTAGFRVAATPSMHGGYPDRWYAHQHADEVKAKLEAALKVDAARSETSIRMTSGGWLPQPGSHVEIRPQHRTTMNGGWGGAKTGRVSRVDHASMGGQTDVRLEVVLLDGLYANTKVAMRLDDLVAP